MTCLPEHRCREGRRCAAVFRSLHPVADSDLLRGSAKEGDIGVVPVKRQDLEGLHAYSRELLNQATDAN